MKICRIIITISLLMVCYAAEGQKKWKWELGLGGSQNSGNVSNFNLKHNQEIARNDSVISCNANYSIVYQRDNGTENNKGINSGIKFDLYQYSRWSPFMAAEMMSNHYKGYQLKFSGLAGLKFRICKPDDKYDYSISLATIYEKVKYTSDETLLKKDLCRLSLRPKIKQKIGDGIIIKNQTFYQPKINELSDYVFYSKTSIENKITAKLFLNISFCYEYRSIIPEDVKSKYDISTDISIKIKI